MKAPKEKDVQRQCLDYLRLRGAVALRINSGAMAGTHKGKQWFMRFNDTPGCSDILACVPLSDDGAGVLGRFLAVEVKGPKGRLRPNQAAFLDSVRAAGGLAICVKSLDDLIAALEAEGLA